jgi:hypothetical protein
MIRHVTLSAFLLLTLSNCTTTVESNPARTATEQMLLSTASDRAAENLAPEIPKGKKVFVDNTNFEGTDSKYAIASIRSHLLARGIHLVEDKKTADVIIETRAGALSTDRRTFIVGIPQFNLPIPLASAPLAFPEIALYGTDEQKGVAKFAYAAYDAKTRTLVAIQEPQYGFSRNTKKTVLLFISWMDTDYMPKDAEKEEDSNKSEGSDKDKVRLGLTPNSYSTPPAAPSATTTPTPSTMPAILR